LLNEGTAIVSRVSLGRSIDDIERKKVFFTLTEKLGGFCGRHMSDHRLWLKIKYINANVTKDSVLNTLNHANFKAVFAVLTLIYEKQK